MNPALIPFLNKVGEKLVDRFVGSKKAAAATIAGSTAATATLTTNPGQALFPSDPKGAIIINAIAYIASFLLMLYREKRG